MDMFNSELAQAASRVQIGGDYNPGQQSASNDLTDRSFGASKNDPMASNKPPGMEDFTQDQILEFGRML